MIDPCLKIRAGGFLRCCGSGFFRSCAARRSDQLAGPDNDLMNDSLHSVALWRELALLDGSFDEYVVALLEIRRDAGKLAIERQVVPIGVLLRFAIGVLVPVALAETGIRDGCSRRKIPD